MSRNWLTLDPTQLQLLYNSGGPASPPPPGTVSNFEDPPTLYRWAHFTLAAGIAISTSAVAVRLFTRWKLMKSVVIEDYIIVIAWLSQIGEFVPNLLALSCGVGKHIWDMSLKEFIRGSAYIPSSCLPYGVIIMFTKAAILLQYLRVFVPVRQMNLPLYIACWLCLAITVLFYIITTINDSIHIGRSYSNPSLLTLQQFYLHSRMSFKTTGFFNVISDAVILLLPLPTILRLKIPFRKKCVVMGLFVAGLLACLASTMRLYYTWLMFNSADISWNYSLVALWSWAEFTVGILVFCLPVTPTFFRYCKSKWCGPITHRIKSGSQGSWSTGSEDNFLKKVDSKTPEMAHANSVSTFSLNKTQSSISSHPDIRMLDPVLYPDEIGVYNFRPRHINDVSHQV